MITELHFRRPAPTDDAVLEDWRHVHNTIIPAHILSLDEVRERAERNHLEVAYLDEITYRGEVLVGCSTVRPPSNEAKVATVIVRVLPAYRRQGFGTDMYERGLALARKLGAEAIETVVLSSNADGLQFALKHGFMETERYMLDGDTIPWIDLRLADFG